MSHSSVHFFFSLFSYSLHVHLISMLFPLFYDFSLPVFSFSIFFPWFMFSCHVSIYLFVLFFLRPYIIQPSGFVWSLQQLTCINCFFFSNYVYLSHILSVYSTIIFSLIAYYFISFHFKLLNKNISYPIL